MLSVAIISDTEADKRERKARSSLHLLFTTNRRKNIEFPPRQIEKRVKVCSQASCEDPQCAYPLNKGAALLLVGKKK